MDVFTVCVNFVLHHEGGYVNNPSDPGGETNYGISKRAYPNLDIKNLKKPDAIAIYYRDYWLPLRCGDLEPSLAACVFDTGVNMGVQRAKFFLGQTKEPKEYLELRTQRYLHLVKSNPKLKIFIKGWLNRVNDLKKFLDTHDLFHSVQ